MSVVASRQGGVEVLDLDRPHRLNALDVDTVENLHARLEDAERSGARAVLLRGRGRAFCSGFDLKQELSRSAEEGQLARLQALTARLRQMDVPSVCAVQGVAVGAGAELALACDIVVVATDARLSFPDVRAGFAAGGGVTSVLPRLIGVARARMLLLTGGEVSGAQAHAIGMVAASCAEMDLEDEATTISRRLADLAPEAVARVRASIDAGSFGQLDDALARELDDMLATKYAPAGAATVRNFRAHGTYTEPDAGDSRALTDPARPLRPPSAASGVSSAPAHPIVNDVT
ncbi:enoyl-CoA hydratase/isomerase family protein [Aeromicrobium sp.]|uniref:enoyl-CoA hydratase/isomerase family protein n=1 Tax=Aeromicrobium sp. TaxID=1871063 RepID=UPI0025C13765|nr:enoyl-CoA hydratase/isomerase family protein [Aeromicrobium sp.]MCK5890326.1 enoyl-CoA hydratase/isomerase family protein [Aeromicrobium sp.]